MKNIIKNSKSYKPVQKLTCYFSSIVAVIILLTACQKQETVSMPCKPLNVKSEAAVEDSRPPDDYKGIGFQTYKELLQVRAATTKYRNINNAFADGYEDINVVMENMGYHFMRSAILDAQFEISKPEILVYNKDNNGIYELVAVEYAAPLDLLPGAPPAGFTGSSDVWDKNLTFGLWTLHAWIWKLNPDGVFNPMNPLVQLPE